MERQSKLKSILSGQECAQDQAALEMLNPKAFPAIGWHLLKIELTARATNLYSRSIRDPYTKRVTRAYRVDLNMMKKLRLLRSNPPHLPHRR